jgi:hypothetical protein
MKSRKEVIFEALLAKASLLADAHLATSERNMPKIFRKGLYYSESGRAKLVDEENHAISDDAPSGGVPSKAEANGEGNQVSLKEFNEAFDECSKFMDDGELRARVVSCLWTQLCEISEQTSLVAVVRKTCSC